MKINPMTEQECREFKVPYFDSIEELKEFIDSLDILNNDYGTAAYSMSLAGTAAFNYIAHKFGCTGFQASCADLDMVRRIRLIEGPFMISKLEDVVYPQSNLKGKLESFLTDSNSKEGLKKLALKNLTEYPDAHPAVVAHWIELSK